MMKSSEGLLSTMSQFIKGGVPAGTPLAPLPTIYPARRAGLRTYIRRAALLGWPGVLASGLLAASATFYFSTVLQAQEQLAAARHRAISVQGLVKYSGENASFSGRTPEEQLDKFYKMFPQDNELPQRIEKIFASARSFGLGLEQGEYRVARGNEGGLVRFQMTFPVKGEYPQIRKYLAALMAEIPTLALQQVQFKRQKVGDAAVDADIRLVLFLLEQKS